MDWTVDWIVDHLAVLDTQPDHDLLRLIHDPRGFGEVVREPPIIMKILKVLQKDGFTPSQRQALHQVSQHRLTLVWGPPGTGKTHFLAHARVYLAEAYWQAGDVLRIGVTAFTHAAIENLR
jgi:DNA replication ATP-dependent helicase Dna2